MSVAWISNRIGFALLGVFVFALTLPSSTLAVMMNPQLVPAKGDLVTPPGAADHVPDHVPGEVLVKFKKGTAASQKRLAHADAGAEVLAEISEIGVQRLKSKRGEAAAILLAKYNRNPHVEYAELNGLVHAQIVPSDPRFSELWGLHNGGQSGGTVDADIDAPEAWDIQTGSPTVVVASIDSGVDYTHPDLLANIWVNAGEIPGNGLDDDVNGYIDDVRGWDFVNADNDPFDDHGHGTHTSGTIGAIGNNGVGVAGVAWQIKIMPLKFLDSTGWGSSADAAAAIIYAANKGANISNNSWGGGAFSQTLSDGIAYAESRGMLFVASAGNDANNNDTAPSYPCSYPHPNIVCVAATDRQDQTAPFSNFGASTVDLGAPGVDVLSTVPTGACGLCDASGYGVLSGTSMASPHVAGAAALLMSRWPTLSMAEVRAGLMASVDPIPALNGVTVSGGRLNIFGGVAATFTVSGSPNVLTVQSGESAGITVSVRSLGSFSEPVTLSLSPPTPGFSGVFASGALTPPSNGSVSTTLTVSVAASTPRGSYDLFITGTDSSGATSTGVVQIIVPGPDFGITILPSTQAVSPGASASYTVEVRSYLGYSSQVTLSSATADPNLSLSFNPATVTPAADGVATSTMTVTTSTSTPSGSYLVTMEGRDGVRIRSASATLISTNIDLTMGGVSGPAAASTGDTVLITDTVQNVGTNDAGGFYVGLYLSADSNVTTSDVRLGSRWVGPVAAGASSTGQTSVVIPESTAPGSYILGAIADVSNIVVEPNESNNAAAGPSLSLAIGPSARPTQAWAARYDGGVSHFDKAYKLAVDGSGNVYVTGDSWNGTNVDIVTVSYDAAGRERWIARYDSGIDDHVRDLWRDAAGNLYIAGYRSDGVTITADDSHPLAYPDVRINYVIIKYDALGREVWAVQYDNGRTEYTRAITGDSAGNIYVTGEWTSQDLTSGGVTTIKYNASGQPVWMHHISGRVGSRDVAVDGSGNVYLALAALPSSNFLTKLNASGVEQWSRSYGVDGAFGATGTFGPTAIVVDAAQNVYVTGVSCKIKYTCASPYFPPGEYDADIATLKYDTTGTLLWEARYDNGQWDEGNDLAVDPAGNVYVTGRSDNELAYPEDWDYLTVKYDASGAQQWASRYHGTERHRAMSLALDGLGSTYVTGWGGLDFATVKYDSAGRRVWDMRYEDSGPNAAYAVAVDGEGNVYVTGSSFPPGDIYTDFATVKYVQATTFTVGTAPAVAVVPQGGSAEFTATIASLNGFDARVNLSCAVAPADPTIDCAVSPSSVRPPINGSITATVSVTTTTATPLQDYTVTVTGTSGTITQSASVTASVAPPPSFSLAATPSTRTVAPSASTNYGISVVSAGGFNAPVTLSCSPSDPSISCSFTSPTVTPPPNGSTTATLSVTAGSVEGSFGITVSGTTPGQTATINVLLVVSPASTARLGNISTRAFVGTGSSAAVGGFIIGGSGTKQVLLRGFGPTLTSFGITGALANPTLDLYWDDDSNPSTPAILVLTNDDWGTALTSCPPPVVACGTPQDILNTGMSADTYAPSNPSRNLDSALLLTLPPGTYTARLSGVSSGTGVGLIGVDDVDTNQTATLINISTRAFVGTGSNVAVGGFIIGGTGNKQLLLRGFGPTLTSFGITGALTNPTLDLYWDDDNNPNTAAILVLTNNDWGTALGSCPAPVVACGTPTDISNTGMSADSYAPTNPNRGLDSALLLTLPPGTYTARLSGVSSGTGVGLIGVDQVGP